MGSSKQIEEQAAAWLIKRDSGEWTQSDHAALLQWLASTAHRVAFIRLEGAWRQADRLRILSAGSDASLLREPSAWQHSPYFNKRLPIPASANSSQGLPTNDVVSAQRGRWPKALAASIVIAALSVAAWNLRPVGSSYRTPVGGLASVPMSDGSKVTLNTSSEIRLVVTDSIRQVKLEQGEAYFDVAKDPDRPFVVDAGTKRVIALGTRFSVRREEDDIRVVVTEGAVRIESGMLEGAQGSQQLSAGAIAHADGAKTLVQRKSLPEAEEYLSWRSGYVVFREIPLAEAVAEFNRYNTRKVVIQDAELEAIKLSGNFRSTSFEAFVRLLEEGFSIDAHPVNDEIVLTKRNEPQNKRSD